MKHFLVGCSICSLLQVSLLTMAPAQLIAASMEYRYDKNLANQVDHVQELIQNLDDQEQNMTALLKAKSEKNAVLKNIDEVMRKKNKLLFEYMKRNQSLKNQLADNQSFTEKLKSQLARREMTSDIDHYETKVKNLQAELTFKQSQLNNLTKLFKRKELSYHQSITMLKEEVAKIEKAGGFSNIRMPASVQEEQQSHLHEKIRMLQTELTQKNKVIKEFERGFPDLSPEAEELVEANRKLLVNLEKAEKEINYLRKQNTQLRADLDFAISKGAEWERYAKGLEQEYRVKVADLQGTLAEYNVPQTIVDRSPASVGEEPYAKYHSKFDEILAEKINQMKIDLSSSPYAGRIVLEIEENFIFPDGETKLSVENFHRVKAILGVYTEKVLSDPKLRDRVESVEFVGHASPWYDGKYVNPNSTDEKAYRGNLYLSVERARSLANLVFSDSYGDFPYKTQLRQKTKVVGKSFSEPIPKRTIASDTDQTCGIYDCERSRRVEIIFYLKEEI